MSKPRSNESLKGIFAAARPLAGASFAHIIGVSVSETNAETATAVLSVIANSRKSRPTIPDMNRRGIKTAISEMLSEITVNPICLRALQRRFEGMIALLDISEDVLDHYDRIIDHKARRDRQRHEREIVETEAREIHHREGAKQRERQRHTGNDRRAQPAQKHQSSTRMTSPMVRTSVNCTSRTDARIVSVRSEKIER